jgi:flavin reductase (DIM6/NTAB) family NADH-FMN oxidoreductase RutF
VADPPDPAEAAGAFDALVARLDTGMVVVTVAAGEERDGCLVGFHSQASIHPRRYVVWLSQANRTYRLARHPSATHLAVHLLGASDLDLAARFGGQTQDDPGVDKLAGLPWTAGPGGAPLVEALPDRFVGRIVSRTPVADGDHVPFLLEPVAAQAGGGAAEPPLRLHRAADLDPGHPA